MHFGRNAPGLAARKPGLAALKPEMAALKPGSAASESGSRALAGDLVAQLPQPLPVLLDFRDHRRVVLLDDQGFRSNDRLVSLLQ